ncbi:hypothetical protein CPB85DRAFT_818926 [Mucidula mucida]|nr:hypothetical protein CPB85DRAFT_818926 [Mucidula mucida]
MRLFGNTALSLAGMALALSITSDNKYLHTRGALLDVRSGLLVQLSRNYHHRRHPGPLLELKANLVRNVTITEITPRSVGILWTASA